MVIGSVQSARSLDQNQYWMKLKALDKFERSVIADTGVAIESIQEGFVTAVGNFEEKRQLEGLGLVEVSFPLTDQMDFPARDSDYHDYRELTEKIQSWATAHPNLVSVVSIGRTIENREIWAVRIGSSPEGGPSKPAVLFMAGHHAREHLSVETPLRIFDDLIGRYAANDTRIRNLLDSREIHFIPAVNPDGLEYDIEGGRYKSWRKNRKRNSDGTWGVDLNRNYSYQWGTGGSSNRGSSDTFMGSHPFSEPETQAIRDYVEAHENISILLSFHTFSKLILYPWGHSYNPLTDARDRAVHETMARAMAQWNGYAPKQSSELYIASGDTTDWSYGEHRIISFTFELDPGSQFGTGGFYPGVGVIPEVVRKNTEPVLYLLDHADNPYRVLSVGISPIQP